MSVEARLTSRDFRVSIEVELRGEAKRAFEPGRADESNDWRDLSGISVLALLTDVGVPLSELLWLPLALVLRRWWPGTSLCNAFFMTESTGPDQPDCSGIEGLGRGERVCRSQRRRCRMNRRASVEGSAKRLPSFPHAHPLTNIRMPSFRLPSLLLKAFYKHLLRPA